MWMKKIGVIGCGWLGSRLVHRLGENYEIHVTTRSPEKAEAFSRKGFFATVMQFEDGDADLHVDPWPAVRELDVLLIMLPFSEKRYGLAATKKRAKQLLSFIGAFKGQLFFMSSTGVYPDVPRVYEEDDLPVADVAVEKMIHESYPQVNVLRLAGLMGDNRLLYKYNISHLGDPVNHIHYADVCRVIAQMIADQSESKVYNVVAPQHPSKNAVIQAQKGLPFEEEHDPEGRIVLSEHLVSELRFTFAHPDPKRFHML